MDARSVVAVMFATVVCVAVLSPIVARIVERITGSTAPALPDTVVTGLADLIKVMLGAVIGWLASGAPGVSP